MDLKNQFKCSKPKIDPSHFFFLVVDSAISYTRDNNLRRCHSCKTVYCSFTTVLNLYTRPSVHKYKYCRPLPVGHEKTSIDVSNICIVKLPWRLSWRQSSNLCASDEPWQTHEAKALALASPNHLSIWLSNHLDKTTSFLSPFVRRETTFLFLLFTSPALVIPFSFLSTSVFSCPTKRLPSVRWKFNGSRYREPDLETFRSRIYPYRALFRLPWWQRAKCFQSAHIYPRSVCWPNANRLCILHS